METLNDLGISYLDLYLMHWPIAQVNDGTGNSLLDSNGDRVLNKKVTVLETWRAMESLVDQGLVRG